MKYLLHTTDFESREHEKAWFIRVTINACRDVLKSVFRRRTVSLDEVRDLPAPEGEGRGGAAGGAVPAPEVPGGHIPPLL